MILCTLTAILDQAREQLEYEILYQPEFAEDTQDSE